MNHLIYLTFGENHGSVYSTQVKQLLNYWSKRETWKVTLIQIADEKNFNELDTLVEQIYIKRQFKLLLSIYEKKYVEKIYDLLKIRSKEKLYFNSRGTAAYSVALKYINTYKVSARCNNLDIRGTIDEFKFSKKRIFFYPFFKIQLNSALKHATSITSVTTNLKDLLSRQSAFVKSRDVKVVPTLSILEFKFAENKKNLAYIGKIAWIDPKIFVKQILYINNLFEKEKWKISIIGHSSRTFGLEKHNIEFIQRMPPFELEARILSYHTGLVLRDSSIVNKVAAPCKISDYLCLGMPLIYSGEIGSLEDFLNIFPECKRFIIHIDELQNPDILYSLVNIKQEEMQMLSIKARSYFGINSVIDRYIEVFNS